MPPDVKEDWVQLFAAIHLRDIFVITLRGCSQRQGLETSQRTYSVASRMKKLSWALYDDPRRREAASGRHGTKIASLPLFTRLQKYRCIALSDVMGQ
jgi:hypothetical protein